MTGDVTLGFLNRMLKSNPFSMKQNGGSVDGATIGATTPSTGVFTTLTSTGSQIRSAATGISAAGTTQGGATALTSDVNNVTTVASSSGVVLPTGVAGMRIRVFNNGTNTLKVYPAGTGTIDSGSASAAATITTAHRGADFDCVSANVWLSALLGAATS